MVFIDPTDPAQYSPRASMVRVSKRRKSQDEEFFSEYENVNKGRVNHLWLFQCKFLIPNKGTDVFVPAEGSTEGALILLWDFLPLSPLLRSPFSFFPPVSLYVSPPFLLFHLTFLSLLFSLPLPLSFVFPLLSTVSVRSVLSRL